MHYVNNLLDTKSETSNIYLTLLKFMDVLSIKLKVWRLIRHFVKFELLDTILKIQGLN